MENINPSLLSLHKACDSEAVVPRGVHQRAQRPHSSGFGGTNHQLKSWPSTASRTVDLEAGESPEMLRQRSWKCRALMISLTLRKLTPPLPVCRSVSLLNGQDAQEPDCPVGSQSLRETKGKDRGPCRLLH